MRNENIPRTMNSSSHIARKLRAAAPRFPIRERIKQMLIGLEESVKKTIYLIHDNSGKFLIDYFLYNIKGVAISGKAPNINAITERFVGSIRRECLDNFLVVNERQLKNIISEYISYYNTMRTHQGIDYAVPQGFNPQNFGKIRKLSILGGLHYHYYHKVA